VRAGLLLTAIPGLAQQFKAVPKSYTRRLDSETAVVQCPCGRRPVLRRGELHHCEQAPCWIPGVRSECGRSFIFAVREVLVFNPARAA
jgi:hypothetical protein